MGQNTLYHVAKGDPIPNADPNSLVAAISGDFVPRNASTFEAEDISGSLGSATNRWTEGWFKKTFVGLSASLISLEEEPVTKKFLVKVAGSIAGKFGVTGILDRGTFANNYVEGTLVPSISGSSTSATTYASVTITTTGRPVLVFLNPNLGASWLQAFQGLNQSGAPNTQFRILRDSTLVYFSSHEYPGNGLSHAPKTYQLPPSCIWFLDTGAAAGAHTYNFQMNIRATTSGTSYAGQNIQLVAYELA